MTTIGITTASPTRLRTMNCGRCRRRAAVSSRSFPPRRYCPAPSWPYPKVEPAVCCPTDAVVAMDACGLARKRRALTFGNYWFDSPAVAGQVPLRTAAEGDFNVCDRQLASARKSR